MKKILIALCLVTTGCVYQGEVVPASEVGKVREHTFIQSNNGQLIYNPRIKQYAQPQVKSVDEMLAQREQVKQYRQEMGMNEQRDAYRRSEIEMMKPEAVKARRCIEAVKVGIINYEIRNNKMPSDELIAKAFNKCNK